jgi:hypothetical protein
MTKKLIVLGIIIAFVMVLSVSAIAANPKATLINSSGDKVVVVAGSKEAQNYFANGYVLMGAPLNTCKDCVGAFPGPDVYGKMFFHEGFNQGAKILNATSTMKIAFTLTAAQVCNNGIITVNDGATPTLSGGLTVASLDVTMPATTTLFAECLKVDGDSLSFLFINESPTAASTTELIEGTGGEDFLIPSAGDATIAGAGGAARVTLIRKNNFLANGTKDLIMRIDELAP